MKYCAHDYQAYATDFVLSHPYCGLILDMGLGKSVITLTALWDLLLDSFDVGCVLVVALSRKAMIYIINRENVSWLVEHTTWRFDALVIDERRPRHSGSRRSKRCAPCAAG